MCSSRLSESSSGWPLCSTILLTFCSEIIQLCLRRLVLPLKHSLFVSEPSPDELSQVHSWQCRLFLSYPSKQLQPLSTIKFQGCFYSLGCLLQHHFHSPTPIFCHTLLRLLWPNSIAWWLINHRNLFLGGWEVQDQSAGKFVVWWGATLWFMMSTSCCVLSQKEQASSPSLFYKGSNILMRVLLSQPNHLPQFPSLSSSRGLEFQHLREDTNIRAMAHVYMQLLCIKYFSLLLGECWTDCMSVNCVQ